MPHHPTGKDGRVRPGQRSRPPGRRSRLPLPMHQPAGAPLARRAQCRCTPGIPVFIRWQRNHRHSVSHCLPQRLPRRCCRIRPPHFAAVILSAGRPIT
uniref:Uncharacterized protein n=1 Tax=Aegilops tauschii subsp. strangulata TaxID=200361 RepID=A0A453BNU4_AEGTS